MTATTDDFTDDDLGTDEEPGEQRDTRDANRAGFERRQRAREQRDAEAAALKAENETLKRDLAMRDVRDDLAKITEGPLNAFLRTYQGEATADAIRKALAEDPDFRDLVKIAPDPRDAAAAEQAANATNLAGSATTSGQITATDVHKWSADRKAAFRKQHPETWNLLLNSDGPVATPVGWA